MKIAEKGNTLANLYQNILGAIMIGTGELLVILGIVLLLFGGKKLPEIARNLGQGIREFKKACNGLDEEIETIEVRPQTPPKKDSRDSEPSEPI